MQDHFRKKLQAQVVQRLDSANQRINHFPANKYQGDPHFIGLSTR